MGVTGGIRPTARNVAHMAEQVPDVPHQWGVIGISRAQWGLLAAALSLGGNVRVGLEDNFYLPDGEMARSNGELVARAARMATDCRAAAGDGRRGAGAAGPVSALAGLRVLDLTRLLPGGYCTLLLADHGADVIKVEDTGAGDYARADPPSFASLNRGKRSIQLDLKSARVGGTRSCGWRASRGRRRRVVPAGRDGPARRGLRVLRAANPSLVYCAITGYGQDGPLRSRAGHDLNYLARTGVLALSGDGGRAAGAGRRRRSPTSRAAR